MGKSKSWFGRGNTRALAISTAVFALLVTPFAFAVGEGDPIIGGERNPNNNQSQALQEETEIIGSIAASSEQKGGYVTRQSNTSTGANAGGGAIYGCRSTGQNPDTDESCIRANNLADGLAFSFDSNGTIGGTISVGDGGDGAKPFTTNATGVATGLNADEVDGIDGAQIQQAASANQRAAAEAGDRFALVNDEGVIIRQTGGFETVDCYEENANCYIDIGEEATDNGLTATIATSNGEEQAGDDGTPLTGEISTSPCDFDFVDCAPDDTEESDVIVVAPRDSDGSEPPEGNRYFFYVTVSGADSKPEFNEEVGAEQDPDAEE